MKAVRLEGAFTPVPERVHQRFENALKEKQNMSIRHLRRPLALILTLALLALAGLAYAAAKTGILDYLVGGKDNASDALLGIVQTADGSASADGIRVDLTGAVYDGDRLSLSFDMTNEDPKSLARVTLDTVTLGGEAVGVDFSSAEEQWLPNVFGVDVPETSRNPVHGGMLSTALTQALRGIVQGEATFVVTRPTNGRLIVLDPMMWYDYDRAIEDAETRADYAARRALVQGSGAEIGGIFDLGDGLDVRRRLDEGYTVVDINGELLLSRAPYSALAEEAFGDIPGGRRTAQYPGQMVETARITLPFTIDADTGNSARVSLTAEDIELSDCTVHFERALLTPLSTMISFTLTPKGEASYSAAEALQERYLIAPEILDENGAPVEFLNMEGYTEAYCDNDGNGGYVLRVEYAYGGVKVMPGQLRFTLAESPFDTSADAVSARKEFMEKVYLTLP